MTVNFPKETRGKDVICEIKHDSLKLGRRGEKLLIDVRHKMQKIHIDELIFLGQILSRSSS